MSLRYHIFIILFICFTPLLHAQKKFLFDATKAEMASNADWVIDADQHNIGFNGSSAVVGNGNESNPQQFPTPDQSTVTSSTPETYWDGALSAWGIDLVKKGYEVETLPYDGKITYGDASNPQDLSNYDVFVVDEPNNTFSASEKTAILNFVKNGGGLCMISDHKGADRNNNGWDSPHVWNDLMQNNSVQTDPFGISFDYNWADYHPVTNIPNLPGNPVLHGEMGDVTEVAYYGATTMTLNPADNASVKGLVYQTGSSFGNDSVLVATATFGKGKVFAMSDSSPADDGSGDPNDRNLYNGWTHDANGNHERLIMNASIWLAGSTTTAVKKIQDPAENLVFITQSGSKFFLQTGKLTPKNNYHLIIFNLSGQKVDEINRVQGQHRYSIPLLSKTVYIYQLTDRNKMIKSGKFYF